jgi:NADPH:quinone reductase
MRAAVLRGHRSAPEVEQWQPPQPGPGESLIELRAAPITPLDLLCASGTSYFGPPALPYVPGVQGVGLVVKSATVGRHHGLVLHHRGHGPRRRQPA